MEEKILNLRKERELLQKEGNILKEVEVLREISTLSSEHFGSESDEFIKALNELGGTLKYIGKYDEAKKYLNTALSTIKKKYGDKNLAYATTLLNLIEVHRFAGEYDKLKRMYEEIIKIYQENNSDETLEYAALCNNYGLFLQNSGDFENAYKEHMKSLYIIDNILGAENNLLEYAVTLSNLFHPSLQLGFSNFAVESLNKSIELFENEVGVEHPLYAASLNNMAVYYYNKKDYGNTLNYFKKSAEICKKTMGEDSDNYKNIVSNIEFIKKEFNL